MKLAENSFLVTDENMGLCLYIRHHKMIIIFKFKLNITSSTKPLYSNLILNISVVIMPTYFVRLFLKDKLKMLFFLIELWWLGGRAVV